MSKSFEGPSNSAGMSKEFVRGPITRGISGLYEFGPFRLDLERRVFTRDQQVLPLAPKTFRPARPPRAEPRARILEARADERTVARHHCRRGQPLLSGLGASQSARRGWGTLGRKRCRSTATGSVRKCGRSRHQARRRQSRRATRISTLPPERPNVGSGKGGSQGRCSRRPCSWSDSSR
jgi:hypothetical protein